jgi:hypothetical protein
MNAPTKIAAIKKRIGLGIRSMFVEELTTEKPVFVRMASLQIRTIKKGRAKRPVQELRLMASLLSLPTVWNTGHRRF